MVVVMVEMERERERWVEGRTEVFLLRLDEWVAECVEVIGMTLVLLLLLLLFFFVIIIIFLTYV